MCVCVCVCVCVFGCIYHIFFDHKNNLKMIDLMGSYYSIFMFNLVSYGVCRYMLYYSF